MTANEVDIIMNSFRHLHIELCTLKLISNSRIILNKVLLECRRHTWVISY
ncbi:hypothetical protein BVRB_006730 [Beta vulgaris subsp. vulgaris]|uniref:Uncharacterized protein n=1 Tax=Beta vulgaris subsp. vulgaris TaxID=3555 RepID=A0A0J8B3A9_BETVV|nr:hypothetical protein BVRB_006730 [Beta vulgaris subsp. vulgaris]